MFTALLAAPSSPPDAAWRPSFVRPSAGERAALAALCRAHGIIVHDTIDRQLAELALVRFPSPDAAAERTRFIDEMIARAGDAGAIGNWVWYAWDRRLVHVLDEAEYFEVITNRNRDKITLDEQARLRTRRVGVLGLSVGGEAAVTVAQEHLCGELVLADHDQLDLSNLNRLGAGCDELGVRKTTIVARRIARLDPYLRVTLFDDGVHARNVGEFLDGLDLLIEECDDLALKHRIRALARERGIDLVFAADERGFFSIEPYATHPELRSFHGRIDTPPLPRDEYESPLAFMRALTDWLGGWSNVSPRSRRSLEQIGTTLCGYPQLAGEARYAAGQVAHAARRLLLGERVAPYIGNLDLDELLSGGGDA